MKTFILSVVGSVVLSEDAIWPDGDAPENPTEEDVEHLIEECGGIGRVIDDWNLTGALYLSAHEVRNSPAPTKEDGE